jgi:glycosyltransferase involved in cell wall biosynthesis
LRVLWDAGVRTVPVVHNSRAGWRNDPASWDPRHVPAAVACAEAVRREMVECGCRVPVTVLRHRPRVGQRATELAARREIRDELRVGEGTFLVGAIGAIKPQKDHARALEVLAHLARRRDAVLVILGGILERSALGELDRLLAAAVRLGMADRLRLPVRGRRRALARGVRRALNVSRFEGLSIAVQEALAAGPSRGRRRCRRPGRDRATPGWSSSMRARRRPSSRNACTSSGPRIACATALRARSAPGPSRSQRGPRRGPRIETLFVTANLNAGGAQRSLVNLAGVIARPPSLRHRGSAGRRRTPRSRASSMRTRSRRSRSIGSGRYGDRRIAARPRSRALGPQPLLLERGAGREAPGRPLRAPRLRILDVTPGPYAFEELEEPKALAEAIAFDAPAYYGRLDVLVLKHAELRPPPARRIEVIPNGVAARAPGGHARVPRFLVSGRIAPSKHLETIIAAFAGVERTYPAAELHVLGVAEPRHADYASRLQAQSSPAFAGRGAGFDLAHLGESWTAAVVLGTHQGCPNAVLEAMSAAIPVIANASGGTGELIVHDVTGWLLPEAADAHALAAAMLSAWTDAPRAARWRRARVSARASATAWRQWHVPTSPCSTRNRPGP